MKSEIVNEDGDLVLKRSGLLTRVAGGLLIGGSITVLTAVAGVLLLRNMTVGQVMQVVSFIARLRYRPL